MALCINQSGTWRNITTLCVNESGTWRNIVTGCINESGTWRRFLDPLILRCPLGSVLNDSWIICRSGGIAWTVGTTSVKRNWYCRNDGITTMQSITGCTGWFIPSYSEILNPGFSCRTYWSWYSGGSSQDYWTNTEIDASRARTFRMANAYTKAYGKNNYRWIPTFRCVTY